MKQKATLSILIQGRNRGYQLDKCIQSARGVSDEIVYVDTGSNDNSLTIAKKYNIKIYSIGPYDIVEPARMFGIQKCTKDWILFIDIDERISPVLKKRVRKLIDAKKYSSYYLSRKNLFARKVWMKSGGWWPDKVHRLIKRSALIDWPPIIHSSPKIKGESCEDDAYIIHYWKDSIENMVDVTCAFENHEADLLYMANKKVNILILFRKFIAELNRRLILKKGYEDGTMGIIMSVYQAYSKTITYLFLYEKYKKSSYS